MKVTKFELFFVAHRWLFLKIETDEGISGWGEPVLEGKALTVATAVDELMDHVIGKDPFQIERHWQRMKMAKREVLGIFSMKRLKDFNSVVGSQCVLMLEAIHDRLNKILNLK